MVNPLYLDTPIDLHATCRVGVGELHWGCRNIGVSKHKAFSRYRLSIRVATYAAGLKVGSVKFQHGFKMLRFHTSPARNQLLGYTCNF